MDSNKRALMILQMLVFTAVVIFLLEKKFLIYESRGATLSHYEDLNGMEDVLLLVDDFEGLPEGKNVKSDSLLKASSFFDYGSAKIFLDHEKVDKNPLASKTSLMVKWVPSEPYGGFGKGVGANIVLNQLTDFLNFRVYVPTQNGTDEILKVMIWEDDDDNGILNEQIDERWGARVTIPAKDQWQLISIPLKDFVAESPSGDKQFNVTRKGGLHSLIFHFEQPDKYTADT